MLSKNIGAQFTHLYMYIQTPIYTHTQVSDHSSHGLNSILTYTIIQQRIWFVYHLKGLNGAKQSYGVHEGFADQPSHFWDDGVLVIFLCYQNMKPILTTHTFLWKPLLHDVFCQSAITKMTVGTVRSFHGRCEKVVLCILEWGPSFLDLLSN